MAASTSESASKLLLPLPGIVTDPNAVLKDTATWLHGGAPNYDKVNSLYEKGKESDGEDIIEYLNPS